MADAKGNEERLLTIIRTQSEIVATSLDLDRAMQVVADRAMELTGAGGAIIQTPEGEQELRLRVASGDLQRFVGDRIERNQSLAGRALAERRPLHSEDCGSDVRVDRRAVAAMDIGSLVCVPLIHHDEPIGVLAVAHGEAHRFSAADRQALELMSDLIAAQMAHADRFAVEAHESRHDALTGLANRRAYEERLDQEISRAERYRHPLSLCIFDLDGFKTINDRQGHPAGDEILGRVADVLRQVRRSDKCFRIGGDEFAMLMPETTREQAGHAINRLVGEIEEIEHPPGVGRIGVSFGITAGHGDAATLHGAADRQLLSAKARLYGRPALRSIAAAAA